MTLQLRSTKPSLAPQMPPSRRRRYHEGLYVLLVLCIALASTSAGAFLPRGSFFVPRSRSYLLVTPTSDTPPSSHLIDLQTFLKLTNLVSTGGDAKSRIQGGECKVNGAVEERRAKKLFPGDRVELGGVELDVKKEVAARGYVLKVKVPKEQGPGYTAPSKAKEYSGEFRTDEWRAERKAKKYARKKENQERGGGEDDDY
jgi:ribosome-associated protein